MITSQPRPWTPALALALALGLALPAAAAAPPRRRAPGEAAPSDPDGNREVRPRRSIEEAPPPSQAELAQRETLDRRVVATPGCHLRGMARLRERLLKMRNRTQLMSLEVWGDTRQYRPGQKVLFYFRSPRAALVTLFWIGPNGDIIVPLANQRIAAERNVQIDTGGIVVPPLGQERWVAVSALERVAIPCGRDEAALLGAIDRFERIPHGVGRWEVHSE
jgi:hypothetical protein